MEVHPAASCKRSETDRKACGVGIEAGENSSAETAVAGEPDAKVHTRTDRNFMTAAFSPSFADINLFAHGALISRITAHRSADGTTPTSTRITCARKRV
eukprot:786820_1